MPTDDVRAPMFRAERGAAAVRFRPESRLIERGLAQELNGEVRLDYEPAGVVCEIVMPVSRGEAGG